MPAASDSPPGEGQVELVEVPSGPDVQGSAEVEEQSKELSVHDEQTDGAVGSSSELPAEGEAWVLGIAPPGAVCLVLQPDDCPAVAIDWLKMPADRPRPRRRRRSELRAEAAAEGL